MDLVAYNEKHKAIIKHAQGSYKKGKRPAQVLEEDDYVDSLSHIIKRDFFPGLAELERDEQRSGSSRIRPASTRMFSSTPSQRTAAPTKADKMAQARDTLSLDRFQARYTSEDNASFQDILDDSNLKRRERYAWLYKDNKIHSVNVEHHEDRLALEATAGQSSSGLSSIGSKRIASVEMPRNVLMFSHDGIDTDDNRSTQVAHEPKINHAATALSAPSLNTKAASPSASLVGRAIRGELLDADQEPHVGGFTFVATPAPEAAPSANPFDSAPVEHGRPFSLPEIDKRDQILNRLTQERKEKLAGTPKASPLARLANSATPKFKSSPVIRRSMLSPAAHRLMGGQGGALRNRLSTPKPGSNLR